MERRTVLVQQSSSHVAYAATILLVLIVLSAVGLNIYAIVVLARVGPVGGVTPLLFVVALALLLGGPLIAGRTSVVAVRQPEGRLSTVAEGAAATLGVAVGGYLVATVILVVSMLPF